MELRCCWMLPGQIGNSYQPNTFHLVGTLKNCKTKQNKTPILPPHPPATPSQSKEFARSFAKVSLEQVA